MKNFLLKLLFAFAILIPIFFFISPRSNPPKAQATDPCRLVISSGPYDVGEHITVKIENANPFTNYHVNVVRIPTGIVYDEIRASGPIVPGGSVFFPDFVPGSGGDYSFAASNDAVGLPCFNAATGITITVTPASTLETFVYPNPMTEFPVGIKTLPSVALINMKPGEGYVFKLDGPWSDFDKLWNSVSGSRVEVWIPTSSELTISSICENGQANRDDCGEDFREGLYTIGLYKNVGDEYITFTSFIVGSAFGPPVEGKNPCPLTIDSDGDGEPDTRRCNTALGNITAEIGPFAQTILSIGIGLAGGIALIIMVIGSIRVLTSAGDPKNVAAGREMIIAAVAGLLFLIFSVMILRFVGVRIIDFPV